MKKIIEKAAVLIEALPYIQSFKNKIVVIKYGGSVMVNNDLAESVLRDVVFMAAVGMKPILVHGGGSRISDKMKEVGKTPQFEDGLRVTDEETMQIVKGVLLEVNKEIVKIIESFGGVGEPLLEIIETQKQYLYKENKTSGKKERLDIGYVGDIVDIVNEKIFNKLAKGVIPVVPPVGIGSDRHDYNVNADLAASAIAGAVKAEKLVFISDVPGILVNPQDESSLMATLSEDEVENLVEKKVISGGMLPKIKAGICALDGGVHKTHIIDGRLMHSLLLEIFTDKGVGTQIIKEKE